MIKAKIRGKRKRYDRRDNAKENVIVIYWRLNNVLY